jgi:hypothetical protein
MKDPSMIEDLIFYLFFGKKLSDFSLWIFFWGWGKLNLNFSAIIGFLVEKMEKRIRELRSISPYVGYNMHPDFSDINPKYCATMPSIEGPL